MEEPRVITKGQARLLYLEQNYDFVIPFESKTEYDYITFLKEEFNILVEE